MKLLPSLSTLALLSFILCFVASCAFAPTSLTSVESKPRNIDDICAILSEKPQWIEPSRESHKKWGIPIELMFAIIRYESSFRASARPLDRRGRRLSSAYGYAQAIDGTWDIYQKENSKSQARRTNFNDAIDFIGWYSNKALSNHEGEISPFDVTALYVFYHDGWSALPQDGSREIKPEVLEVAAKVYQKTLVYHRQLSTCPRIANALYEEGTSVWSSDQPQNSGGGGTRRQGRQNVKWF